MKLALLRLAAALALVSCTSDRDAYQRDADDLDFRIAAACHVRECDDLRAHQPAMWALMQETCAQPYQRADYFGEDHDGRAPAASCFDFDPAAARACLTSLRAALARVAALPRGGVVGCDLPAADACVRVFPMSPHCMMVR